MWKEKSKDDICKVEVEVNLLGKETGEYRYIYADGRVNYPLSDKTKKIRQLSARVSFLVGALLSALIVLAICYH
jgi:hypothetical protein